MFVLSIEVVAALFRVRELFDHNVKRGLAGAVVGTVVGVVVGATHVEHPARGGELPLRAVTLVCLSGPLTRQVPSARSGDLAGTE